MKRLLVSLILICWCVVVLQAQPLETPDSSGVSVVPAAADSVTIEQLSAEVAQLRKRADRWDKVRSRLPRINGYLQAGYQGATGSSSFLVKSVRVWMSGDLSEKFDYLVQMELVSPRLLDAYVRYKPFGALNFQIGEFKIPFTIENTDYTPLTFEFIDYPLALTRLCGFNDLCGVAASGRDLGAMVYGGFFRREGRAVLSYDLAVFNGEGINMWDKNKSKDIVGRLMVRPVRGLTLAGYYYWGEYGPGYSKRIRYGGGACYDRGRVVVRSEYIGGTTGVVADGEASFGELESEGWYAMAGVRPVRGLTIAARYDTFLENRSDDQTRQTNYTLGVTWEPIKYLRCQLNYTYEDFSLDSSLNRNVVLLMFTGIF